MSFYQDIIAKSLKNRIILKSDSVLVIAGGKKDRDIFLNNGFNNVTISNLDYDRGVKNYEPYNWKNEDAESLSFKDFQFD